MTKIETTEEQIAVLLRDAMSGFIKTRMPVEQYVNKKFDAETKKLDSRTDDKVPSERALFEKHYQQKVEQVKQRIKVAMAIKVVSSEIAAVIAEAVNNIHLNEDVNCTLETFIDYVFDNDSNINDPAIDETLKVLDNRNKPDKPISTFLILNHYDSVVDEMEATSEYEALVFYTDKLGMLPSDIKRLNLKSKLKPIELQLGEQYIRRDGQITGPLQLNHHEDYRFKDPKTGMLYLADGRYIEDELPVSAFNLEQVFKK